MKLLFIHKIVLVVLGISALALGARLFLWNDTVFSKLSKNARRAILFDVPFTAQAPLGNWQNEQQQNACEEASALMAMHWVDKKPLTLPEAEKELIAISNYEFKNFGHFHDTSAEDTVERIFKGYFNYHNVELKRPVVVNDIKQELGKGNLVLVPVNGKKLNNPSYADPAPDEHMILVIGYDGTTKEFVTHDPGSRQGGGFRYAEQLLQEAMQDYPSGFHEPTKNADKAMIVVKPRS